MREEGNSRPSEVRRQAHHLPKSRQRLFCHPQEPGERVLHRGDAGHDDPLCDAAEEFGVHGDNEGEEGTCSITLRRSSRFTQISSIGTAGEKT